MKKVAKKLLWTTCIMAFVCIVLMLICNQIVVNNAEGKAFSDIDSIKHNRVGLLLGTTPQARITKIIKLRIPAKPAWESDCER